MSRLTDDLMSDRDRLVELLKEADDATEVHDCDYPTYEKAMQAFYTSIADHLLANGVIVLPCKPNELVWVAHKRFPTCETLYACNSHIVNAVENGYAIGHTKEEAEAKLAGWEIQNEV